MARAARILVVGGAGVIGKSLCRALLDRGHRVICIDTIDSTLEKKPSDWYVYRNMRLSAVGTHSVSSSLDYIIYVAEHRDTEDRVGELRECFNGTMGIMDLAKETGSHLILVSSETESITEKIISVYGEQHQVPYVTHDISDIEGVAERIT